MTAFDAVRDSFAEKFKRAYLRYGLRFPMEMSFSGQGWEVGAFTDGNGDVRMFTCGTPPTMTDSFPCRVMHGVDANGKHFMVEVAHE